MSTPRSQKTLDKSFPSLRIERASKSFTAEGETLPVLANISLSAEKGQIISILGKSGCGKSTLLNMATNLEIPDSGRVITNGSIGYLPQGDTLLPWRTVLQNIVLPKEIAGKDISQCVRDGQIMLRKAGLGAFANEYPAVLSGGMKQRVCLIRTILQEPDIILLDEPFSAIDFDSRLQLSKSIRDYVIKNKKIALLVTHNIEEAISMADSLVILRGRPAQIIYRENIHISEQNRDPVSIRKNTAFHRLFKNAWHHLKSSV